MAQKAKTGERPLKILVVIPKLGPEKIKALKKHFRTKVVRSLNEEHILDRSIVIQPIDDGDGD